MAPPIPKDSFKQVPKHFAGGAESPWDDEPVISSAPAPTTPEKAQDVEGMLPNWMGRPIVHPDHAQDLETEAAINEYGLKMPRGQAEDEAHKSYVGKQREEAASHHLSGMKVANATGDIEAARKHHMMYSLHAKALGFEPVGAAPSNITDKHVYKLKFKPHKGDMFAAGEGDTPAKTPEPDAIMGGYKGPKLTAPAKTAPAQSMKNATPLHSGKSLNDHLMGKGEGFRAHVGDVFAILAKAEEQTFTEEQVKALQLLHAAGAKLLVKAIKTTDEKASCPTCGESVRVKQHSDKHLGERRLLVRHTSKIPLGNGVHQQKVCEGSEHVLEDAKKGEMSSVPKKSHCACEAYKFPHRHGGGYCRQKKP